MKTQSQPVRRGREYYHTAASACRYLGISKSTFFNYRREGLFEVVAVPILGKIRYLYAQSKLDKVFRPIDLLAAVQSIENRNKKRS
ncbi:MAG: hypothetical protein IKJ08_07070 [Alistipes sp.]|nr:hypothetical protein [Alistipes sp.]MBR4029329.1 hypothetical protein [Alistipes sp.]